MGGGAKPHREGPCRASLRGPRPPGPADPRAQGQAVIQEFSAAFTAEFRVGRPKGGAAWPEIFLPA